jgi:glycosyltransferase involved in cell wall biosynthesis
MNLYIDISEFLQNRFNTGIQRVLREFLERVLLHTQSSVHIVFYDTPHDTYTLLDNDEVQAFLKAFKHYQFKNFTPIDIFNTPQKNKIFFDLDSVWNNDYKRIHLYKKLKKYNFKIYNFIYDLIPVLFPDLVKNKTRNNFNGFLNAVYTYSDFVFFDSESARNDFLHFKINNKFTRQIPSKVVYLGSDFIHKHISKQRRTDSEFNTFSTKKYILFVGTIEPRKHQQTLIKAFETLYLTNPDLHIVLIGSMGWKVEKFKQYLYNHPLKDKNIHHLTTVEDDILHLFYQNSFLVTYLSDYEGYGLPIAESLLHGNITITSNNSSMPEVGKDCAEYSDNTNEAIYTIINKYLQDNLLYGQRKRHIKENYKHQSWNEFYKNVMKEIK